MIQNLFDIFDETIKKLDTFPLDAQSCITKIQKIDNYILKLSGKFMKYIKKDLLHLQPKYHQKLHYLKNKLKKYSMKRKKLTDHILLILHNVINHMKNMFPDNLKSSINQCTKQASILKTRIQKEDVNTEIKQPIYCKCNKFAFGDMIRCDSPKCKIIWYHFECVHLTSSPKIYWYCPNCKKE